MGMTTKQIVREFERYIKDFHPACTSEGVELDLLKAVFALLKEQNVIEDNLLGLQKVVERPQDIRVVTDDGRVIVLKKEYPMMVLNRKNWSDDDA